MNDFVFKSAKKWKIIFPKIKQTKIGKKIKKLFSQNKTNQNWKKIEKIIFPKIKEASYFDRINKTKNG